VLAGEQLAGLKIAIRPGIELSGRVSGLLPHESVRVVSAALPDHMVLNDEPGDSDIYKLTGLPAGELKITVTTTFGRSLSKSIQLQVGSDNYLDFVF
jgi:hypothetical protein